MSVLVTIGQHNKHTITLQHKALSKTKKSLFLLHER